MSMHHGKIFLYLNVHMASLQYDRFSFASRVFHDSVVPQNLKSILAAIIISCFDQSNHIVLFVFKGHNLLE